MPKKYIIIDGNSLVHRAFHAVPPTMNAPDGTPTNAVFGFFAMLLKLIDSSQPDAIVCAFDAGRPAFRMEALGQYKAQRPPMDPNLKVQFPVIEELLIAMNIPVVKIKGWEGDDILGTLSARNEAAGHETYLVSGDRDILQLASEHTKVVSTKKGITDVVIYGPQEVYDRYGVYPSQVPDYLGIKGDTSDNIPGVSGVGEKGAVKLLSEYGTLDGIYEHIDKLKGKQKQNIEAGKEDAYVSKKVATIVRDVDIECDIDSAVFPSFDPFKVKEAFSKYRLNTHMNKILALSDSVEETALVEENNDLQISKEEILEGEEARTLVEKAIQNKEEISLSFYTPEQLTLFGTQLEMGIAVQEEYAYATNDEALELFAKIITQGNCILSDAKKCFQLVFPANSTEEAFVEKTDLDASDFVDISLAAYVLNSSQSSYEVTDLYEYYMQASYPQFSSVREEVVAQALAQLQLYKLLKARMEKEQVWSVYERIEKPLVSVLAGMEQTGTCLDSCLLQEYSKEINEEISGLRKKVYELAGEEFNLDSPKQLSRILFEVVGLKPIKKTKSGYSTDAGVLQKLAVEHEIPALMLKYRELAKLKSTYIDALPLMVDTDGRIHTSFNQMVTTTGRLSSSDPNLQNIPIRTDLGRKIREAFVPLDTESIIVSADYSQIELRLLAHLSEDEHLIEAFKHGADFHANTASRVFGLPVEEVSAGMRSRAKAVNFGIVYGQQAYGLSQSLNIPIYEAQEIIDRYFEAFPGVRRYMDRIVAEAHEVGYAQTMFGRRRYIAELSARNKQTQAFGERTAMNHPMQGSAADIIKLAMVEVDRRLQSEGFEAKLLLQVHDELDFSVPVNEVEALSAMVKEVMENVVELRVPLVVDVSSGKNWAVAH